CSFGETAGKVEADNGALAAQMAPFGAAQRAVQTWQLRPRCHTIAGAEPVDALAGFQNTSAELMSEELERRLGLQPVLDAVVSQRRNPQGQLRLGDARLYAQRLDQDVSRRTRRLGHVVEAHVTEAVEAPGFHLPFSLPP